MILQIRIPGEDLELYQKLKEKYYDVRLIKGRITVEFGIYEDRSDSIKLEEELKDKDFEMYFIDSERGGGMSNTGFAHIVCGINGERLRPFHIVTHGHRALRDHAYFAVKDQMITIDYEYRHRDYLTITKYEAKRGLKEIQVIVEKLWQGYPQDLPNLFEKYRKAIDAAEGKAICYHCRMARYVEE